VAVVHVGTFRSRVPILPLSQGERKVGEHIYTHKKILVGFFIEKCKDMSFQRKTILA
jgi:hypothetical protein